MNSLPSPDYSQRLHGFRQELADMVAGYHGITGYLLDLDAAVASPLPLFHELQHEDILTDTLDGQVLLFVALMAAEPEAAPAWITWKKQLVSCSASAHEAAATYLGIKALPAANQQAALATLPPDYEKHYTRFSQVLDPHLPCSHLQYAFAWAVTGLIFGSTYCGKIQKLQDYSKPPSPHEFEQPDVRLNLVLDNLSSKLLREFRELVVKELSGSLEGVLSESAWEAVPLVERRGLDEMVRALAWRWVYERVELHPRKTANADQRGLRAEFILGLVSDLTQRLYPGLTPLARTRPKECLKAFRHAGSRLYVRSTSEIPTVKTMKPATLVEVLHRIQKDAPNICFLFAARQGEVLAIVGDGGQKGGSHLSLKPLAWVNEQALEQELRRRPLRRDTHSWLETADAARRHWARAPPPQLWHFRYVSGNFLEWLGRLEREATAPLRLFWRNLSRNGLALVTGTTGEQLCEPTLICLRMDPSDRRVFLRVLNPFAAGLLIPIFEYLEREGRLCLIREVPGDEDLPFEMFDILWELAKSLWSEL